MSEKHANFIVNDQKGTAADVRRLAERVRAEVLVARRASTLAFEVEFVGDWSAGTRPVSGRRVSANPASAAVGPLSSSSSAVRRPSTTSRSCRARPSRPPCADRGLSGRRRCSSTSTAAGGGCPADHRRGDRPAAAYDDPAALGRPARSRSAPRSTGSRPEPPAPVVVIALHGPFGEDGTVQALLEAAGLAYTGSGVTASAIGMDKTIFKRLCRGIGLPVVDWLEVPAGALGEPTRPPSGASSTRSRPAPPVGRLMVKPARLGSSVGMTLVHDASELDAALADGLPPRHARPRRDVPGRRARPRGLGHRQRPGPARAVRSRRDRVRPRVLRLRREVHRRPVRDVDSRRGHRSPAGDDPQDRAGRLPGDRRRGLRPGRLPGPGRGRSTSRRSTRSRASPRSASSRRCRPRAATRSPTSAHGSSSSRIERHARPRRPAPDPGGPASMSGRPVARREPGRRLHGAAATRSVRRASAGLSAVACRGGPGDARVGRRDLRRRRLVRVRRTHTSRSTGASLHGPVAASRTRSSGARGQNLFGL